MSLAGETAAPSRAPSRESSAYEQKDATRDAEKGILPAEEVEKDASYVWPTCWNHISPR
jgi:hypothetical protein